MKHLLIILFLFPVLMWGQEREISITQRAIAPASIDLSNDGGWFIQLSQNNWIKTIKGKDYALFPDAKTRSTEVADLMTQICASFDIYIAEQVNAGSFANGTDKFRYHAIRIKDTKFFFVCHVYTRYKNHQPSIPLYKTSHSAAATAAMADIIKALDSLATIASESKDYE